jgi:hypothetical protein
VWPQALAAGAVLAPLLTWRMWWGGQCPPARFLVPIVPFLGLCVALRARGGGMRGLLRWRWPLLALGFGLFTLAVVDPGRLLLVNRGGRPTRLWAALSGDRPLGRYLPGLAQPDEAEARVAILWLVGLGVLLVLDAFSLSRDPIDRLFRGLGLPLLLLLTIGALVDGWARPREAAAPLPSPAAEREPDG